MCDSLGMNPSLVVQADVSPSYAGIQDPVMPDHNFNAPSSMAYYTRGPSLNVLSPGATLHLGLPADWIGLDMDHYLVQMGVV